MKLEWKGCLRLGAVLLGLYLVTYYWSRIANLGWTAIQAAWPLVVGCIVAYVINLPMAFFERHFPETGPRWLQCVQRPLCLILAVCSLVLIVMLLVKMILPELISCVTLLVEQMPGALNTLFTQLEENFQFSDWLSDEAGNLVQGTKDWQAMIEQGINWVIAAFGGAMASLTGILSKVVSGTITVLVALIFSIYLLMGKDMLKGQVRSLLRVYGNKRWTKPFLLVLRTMDDCMHRFIVGQCVEAVILGLLCILGMLLFRFPYAVMIGTLIGFTALLPVVGAYIGAIVGALMILTVSPLQAVFFLLFLVVLQQLEGNLIYPRVVGSSIGLPGIWVLAAVTVGGALWGVGGMLLGVPLTAAAYRLLRQDLIRRQDAARQS